MKPNPNDAPPATVNKLRFIWVTPVAVVGLIVLVMMAGLKWNQWFTDDEPTKQIVRPTPKSVGSGSATERKIVLPGIFGRVRLLGTPPPEKTFPIDLARMGATPFPMPFVRTNFANTKSPSEITPTPDPRLPKTYTTRFYVAGNRESNRAQPPKVDLEFAFDQPELFLRFKCDVHPWMFAYVCVLDHPFFAVTDKAGAFALTNVPPGKYVLEAVHRKAGTLTQEITIGAEEIHTAEFVFEVKAGP